jgi:Xaa-Pro aminopeptidase
VPWNQAHEVAVEILTKGLVGLGILKGQVAHLIKNKTYMQFYPHRIGHWLGMDVHDVGDYKVEGEWRLLEPGMVLTIEPGLYIPPDSEKVDPRWRGIGIRIEDDILVTRDGYEVLTEAIPKTITEIETLMQVA